MRWALLILLLAAAACSFDSSAATGPGLDGTGGFPLPDEPDAQPPPIPTSGEPDAGPGTDDPPDDDPNPGGDPLPGRDAGPPPELPVCNETCPGTCVGGVCQVECGGRGGVDCDRLKCPPGIPCEVECDSRRSCVQVDCSEASSCNVTCTGDESCGQVTCGDGPCDVLCVGKESCAGGVDCRASCACDVTCADDACEAPPSCPEGCEANDDDPGCTLAPEGCNACLVPAGLTSSLY